MRDVYSTSDGATPYECFNCGSIRFAEDPPVQCADCGGEMRNRRTPLE